MVTQSIAVFHRRDAEERQEICSLPFLVTK